MKLNTIRMKFGSAPTGGLLATMLSLAVLLLSTPLRADEPRINVERFNASPHMDDMMSIRTAQQPQRGGFSGGLFITWGKDPLRVVDERGTKTEFHLVDHQVVADLFGSFLAWDQLSVALNLPIVIYSGGQDGFVNTAAADQAGLGDLRLGLKWLALGRKTTGFGLALDMDLTFPTATQGTWAGDAGVTFTPRIVADYGFSSLTTIALNVGYRARKRQSIGPYETSSELQAGLGLRQGFADDKVRILGEILFASGVADFFGRSGSSLEGQIGANVCIAGKARLYAAGGGGFLHGIGDTSVRLTVGTRLEKCGVQPPPDRDKDGVYDKDDACPDTPGVRSRDDAINGCPPDRDKDGIYDRDDACPDDAGIKTDDPRTHGCPDRDGDGVFDKDDVCPDNPGIKTGDADTHGCPDKDGDLVFDKDDACVDVPGEITDDPKTNGCPDKDGDGILDKDDACPEEKGVQSDDPKKHGCPPDRDEDTIVDPEDACPDVPGVASDDPATHGCPKLDKKEEKLEIVQRVEFAVNKAVIPEEWKGPLDQVADILVRYDKAITKVVVEGHTDSTNTDEYNLGLSKRRAKSVRKYLISRGVDGKKLKARGLGESKPVADNGTPEGRQRNRRVVFKIDYHLEQ